MDGISVAQMHPPDGRALQPAERRAARRVVLWTEPDVDRPAAARARRRDWPEHGIDVYRWLRRVRCDARQTRAAAVHVRWKEIVCKVEYYGRLL
ncbi:hypothetical protein ABZP36_004034 [Zizania latifolia]